MSETTTRTETFAKSRTGKQAASSSAEFQFPQFEIPKMEIPGALRDAATKWINQGKENVEKAIKATEGMNGVFENAYSTAAKGAVDCSAKLTEATRTNTVAAFDIAHDLLAAKTLPEVIEITTAGARKQFDALATQNQELWALTQQLVTETIKPIAGGLPKVFNVGAST
jgi:phasin